MTHPAEQEQPGRAGRGLGATPLRSVSTLVVALAALVVLAVAVLSGGGDECRTVAGGDGTREQVCFDQFPTGVGDLFR